MAMSVNVPHFDTPFSRSFDGHAAVVEQDSTRDIENCVEAVLRTERGTRLYVPGFGIDDPTFSNEPIDLQVITQQVLASEPRSTAILSQSLHALIDTIKVGFGAGQ